MIRRFNRWYKNLNEINKQVVALIIVLISIIFALSNNACLLIIGAVLLGSFVIVRIIGEAK